MLAPILAFFCSKFTQHLFSIMLGHELNFELNAMILGVTLKSIMLKFSSIIYLTQRDLRCQKRFRILGFSTTSRSNRSCSLHCLCQI